MCVVIQTITKDMIAHCSILVAYLAQAMPRYSSLSALSNGKIGLPALGCLACCLASTGASAGLLLKLGATGFTVVPFEVPPV